jgi:hypothetical protein
MERRLQHRQAAQCDRRPATGIYAKLSVPAMQREWDAALTRGLRISSRCTNEPDRLK